MAKVGDVRLVKSDGHNVAVQKFVQPEPVTRDGVTKQSPARWEDAGYYGHRIDHAAEHALFTALPEGEKITPALITKAVADIVAATKKVLKDA